MADLRFGDVVVLRDRRRVLVGGREAVLGSRAFDLLLHLIDHRERFVGKEELLDTVWRSAPVEDGNLHVHVHALRQLLGRNVITTARGRGYRFTASLDGKCAGEHLAEPVGGADSAHSPVQLHGRDGALAELIGLAQTHRLLTLTGSGGIGKTRLAQALMERLAGFRRDGVWWIDLTLVGNAEQCFSVVAQALLLPASEPWTASELAERLRSLSGWIVLDNCEHVQPVVSRLLSAVMAQPSQLSVVATSRRPLGHPLEFTFEVLPLALPASDGNVEMQEHCAAVAMFIDRARLAGVRFEIAASEIADVHHLCRSLDGLPLAIELGAARLPLLGVKGLRVAVDNGLRALTTTRAAVPDRHRTMTAVLDWSHQLLSSQEQALFRRLGVFAGSFSVEQAAAVAAVGESDRWEFVDRFEMLVQHMLVVRQPGTRARWRLLETTRHFARDCLDAAGESAPVRRAHIAAMVTAMRALESAYIDGSASEHALGSHATSILPDVMAALSTCSGDSSLSRTGVELFAFSARFLFWGGYVAASQSWADRAAETLGLSPALEAAVRLAWCHIPPTSMTGAESRNASLRRAVQLFGAHGDRLRAMHASAWLALRLGEAGQFQAASIALAAAKRDERTEHPARIRGWRLHVEIMLAQMHSHGQTNVVAFDEMLDDLIAAGDGGGRTAHMLAVDRAQALLLRGTFAQARLVLSSLRDKAVSQGLDCAQMTWLFSYLALAELGLGRPGHAREPLEQALAAGRRADLMHVVADVLAWYLALLGRYRAAYELIGAVEGRLERRGVVVDAVLSLIHHAVRSLTDDACSEEDRRRWAAAGATWSDAGLRMALSGHDARFVP